MSEFHKLDAEDHSLLRSVLRKRQPSSLWLVSSMDQQKPLTPAQRESIKGVLSDEMRETGYGSDRANALQKLIDYFSQP
jgi:hypothetical protein